MVMTTNGIMRTVHLRAMDSGERVIHLGANVRTQGFTILCRSTRLGRLDVTLGDGFVVEPKDCRNAKQENNKSHFTQWCVYSPQVASVIAHRSRGGLSLGNCAQIESFPSVTN